MVAYIGHVGEVGMRGGLCHPSSCRSMANHLRAMPSEKHPNGQLILLMPGSTLGKVDHSINEQQSTRKKAMLFRQWFSTLEAMSAKPRLNLHFLANVTGTV